MNISKRLCIILNSSLKYDTCKLNKTLLIQTNYSRQISTSSQCHLKEVTVEKKDNVIRIRGDFIKDPDTQVNLPTTHGDACPICSLNTKISYTDVLILEQFMRGNGTLLPRSVTGVCQRSQNLLSKLVHQSQRAGLMPELRPTLKDERTNIKSNHKWRKYNIYYNE